jgi:hypothetical protein
MSNSRQPITHRIFRKAQGIFRNLLSDKVVIQRQYEKRVGKPLNLWNPQGFHEKICCMHLNGLTPLHVYCTDKVTAPFYIASRIGVGHVPRRYLVTTDPDLIQAGFIPPQSCMIKTNHDSGGDFSHRGH